MLVFEVEEPLSKFEFDEKRREGTGCFSSWQLIQCMYEVEEKALDACCDGNRSSVCMRKKRRGGTRCVSGLETDPLCMEKEKATRCLSSWETDLVCVKKEVKRNSR